MLDCTKGIPKSASLAQAAIILRANRHVYAFMTRRSSRRVRAAPPLWREYGKRRNASTVPQYWLSTDPYRHMSFLKSNGRTQANLYDGTQHVGSSLAQARTTPIRGAWFHCTAYHLFLREYFLDKSSHSSALVHVPLIVPPFPC